MPDFNDFDDKGVYDRSQSLALDHATRNFVVEFAKENAHIAFNLNPNDVQELLSTVREPRRPVRWMCVTPFLFSICHLANGFTGQ